MLAAVATRFTPVALPPGPETVTVPTLVWVLELLPTKILKVPPLTGSKTPLLSVLEMSM